MLGPFKECTARDPANVGRSDGGRRADMIVSVHPLCLSLPLMVLASLDTDGTSWSAGARTTPFVTVVTDLGGAHPSWFNGGVDRCFVPSDVLREAALDRNVDSSRIVQYSLPIRRGFWRFIRTRTSRAARRPATSRRKRARTWTSRPSGSDWYCWICPPC